VPVDSRDFVFADNPNDHFSVLCLFNQNGVTRLFLGSMPTRLHGARIGRVEFCRRSKYTSSVPYNDSLAEQRPFQLK